VIESSLDAKIWIEAGLNIMEFGKIVEKIIDCINFCDESNLGFNVNFGFGLILVLAWSQGGIEFGGIFGDGSVDVDEGLEGGAARSGGRSSKRGAMTGFRGEVFTYVPGLNLYSFLISRS
jgi:hypothetical protein